MSERISNLTPTPNDFGDKWYSDKPFAVDVDKIAGDLYDEHLESTDLRNKKLIESNTAARAEGDLISLAEARGDTAPEAVMDTLATQKREAHEVSTEAHAARVDNLVEAKGHYYGHQEQYEDMAIKSAQEAGVPTNFGNNQAEQQK